MRTTSLVAATLVAVALSTHQATAAPLAEKFLKTGQLTEGAKALQEHLKKSPKDDEARFGLGVIQFLQSFEHLGGSLYKYGLRNERAFRNMSREFRGVLPQNPNPQKVTYADVRQFLQTWVDDLKRAEQTLSAVKDPQVKLPLHVGLIKLDLFGVGKPVDAAFLFGQFQSPRPQGAEGQIPKEVIENFVIGFDRGDTDWLAGYCNFLCAWGEIMLAVDAQQMFECTAHLFFEKVETPHDFLLEGDRNFEDLRRFDRPLISDILAFIHLWRFEIKEPARMKAALGHLEAMQLHAKDMWKHYQLETDDDNEWIPNPKQTGVLQIKVSQEMLDTWLAVLDEADLILQGKKLIPFWRGKPGERGLNLRKVFTEPRTIEPLLWLQGTAATPYLEKGTITNFASPEMFNRINRTFGGTNFFMLAFWFN